MIWRDHKPERMPPPPPGPPCPGCDKPTTRHCSAAGCRIFECLPCDRWGLPGHHWNPRHTQEAT